MYTQVDYVGFMDELAELNGCKPDFCKLPVFCVIHTFIKKYRSA
jgi:hypothetical protein